MPSTRKSQPRSRIPQPSVEYLSLVVEYLMTGVDEGDFAVRGGDYEIGNAQLALYRHFVRRRSQRREAAEDIESAYRLSSCQHVSI